MKAPTCPRKNYPRNPIAGCRRAPTGKVVATDIDTRYLHRISAPNLEVRTHDILKDDLEKGEYDLAHCRYLLHHLPEPEKGLKRMADSLRPRSWLLIEEDDYGSMLSLDVTDPSATTFAEVTRVGFDFCKKGIADMYFGRRLRGLVEQLGYLDRDGRTWFVEGTLSHWWKTLAGRIYLYLTLPLPFSISI